MSLVPLPDKVARDLEVLFGVGQDRCRYCRYFAPKGIFSTDIVTARCKLRGRNIVTEPGNTCGEFIRK